MFEKASGAAVPACGMGGPEAAPGGRPRHRHAGDHSDRGGHCRPGRGVPQMDHRLGRKAVPGFQRRTDRHEQPFRRRAAGALTDGAGRFVLEAALLFPVLLSATVALMFVGLYAGVQSLALSTAGIAAERAAFSWDNSHRNPVTGAFFPGQYDDLYWRLTGDFPGAALARRKMEAALVTAGPASDGVGRYENAVWRRAVAAGWTAPFRAPDLTEPAGEAGRKTQWSEAFVADPAEWVRTI